MISLEILYPSLPTLFLPRPTTTDGEDDRSPTEVKIDTNLDACFGQCIHLTITIGRYTSGGEEQMRSLFAGNDFGMTLHPLWADEPWMRH